MRAMDRRLTTPPPRCLLFERCLALLLRVDPRRVLRIGIALRAWAWRGWSAGSDAGPRRPVPASAWAGSAARGCACGTSRGGDGAGGLRRGLGAVAHRDLARAAVGRRRRRSGARRLRRRGRAVAQRDRRGLPPLAAASRSSSRCRSSPPASSEVSSSTRVKRSVRSRISRACSASSRCSVASSAADISISRVRISPRLAFSRAMLILKRSRLSRSLTFDSRCASRSLISSRTSFSPKRGLSFSICATIARSSWPAWLWSCSVSWIICARLADVSIAETIIFTSSWISSNG